MKKPGKFLVVLGCCMGVCGVLSYYAFGDVTTFKAPVVWRTDGEGCYRLPSNLAAGVFGAKEVIYTEGDITSITVNYQSVGAVTLEVSADNGSRFVPVINGVPVTSDFFHSGRSIKWRADIAPGSKLTQVSISYTDKAGVSAGFGNPLLCGFKYRKLIKLGPGSLFQSLFNYQTPVKVGESAASLDADVHCEANILADFKDLRFTGLDGSTVLPHYVEKIEGISLCRTAVVWVKVPQISAAGISIYVYYGNAGAPDISCGEDVFDFFDDFADAQLDSGKWQVRKAKDSAYNIAGSRLELYDVTIVSNTYKLKDGIVEYSAALEKGGKIEVIIKGEDADSEEIDRSLSVYSSIYDRLQHCIAVGDNIKVNNGSPISVNKEYNYRVIADGADVSFARYSAGFEEEEAKTAFNDSLGLPEGYIGVCSVVENGHNKVSYDWVRVRKYAAAEPQVLSGTRESKQEAVELSLFVNTGLNPAGRVVLEDSSKPGLYVPAKIRSAFETRILIPSWEGEFVSLDISANAAADFKKNCVNAGYYYASLGDFVIGKEVVVNAHLSPAPKDSDSIAYLEELTLKGSPGIISVIVPNGAEVWEKGSSKDILWSALDYEDSYSVSLEYSLDEGSTFTMLAQKVKNSGAFSWMIPADIGSSSKVKIRVSDANAAAVFDLSDNVFTVKGKEEIEEKESKKVKDAVTWDDWLASKGKRAANINTEVVISAGETIVTNSDIKFKKLVIGDGKGEVTSRVVLKHNIDQQSADIIIRKGGELVQANRVEQIIKGNLVVEAGAVLTHEHNNADEQYQINFSAQSIILEQSGEITAQGRGYSGGAVRKEGKGKSSGRYFSRTASGGSHAGCGGGAVNNKVSDSGLYGAEKAPQDLGSGGAGSWFAAGGGGGGVIRLNAQGVFNISGKICADGADGGVSPDNQFDAGGGAGGSIYLSAGEFSGKEAQITASGGSGHITGGGGGGGRIYLKAPAGGITGTITVNGGEGFEQGKGGSLILE